ncbi:MAG: ABC transporter ATP-binding protein [Candidatus Hodarchaeales archaeon]|jgi:ABC-2 type transport system ATP-binding protein
MEPVIECVNITKRFKTTLALDDVSVNFPKGIVGLVGPNGAGKTTLLKILLGLIWPTNGDAKVLGNDIRSAKEREKIRQNCGYMSERDTFINDVSAKKLVTHFCQLSGLSRTDSLQRAHDVLSFSGIGEERYRKVGTYSKGMKQKLKLAIAIVHSPKLLFLDEPTDGMDPEGRERMLAIIKNLSQESGKNIVLSTHILPDIERIGDHLVVLDRGRIKASKPLKDLLRKYKNTIRVQVTGDPGLMIAEMNKKGYHAYPGSDYNEIEIELLYDRSNTDFYDQEKTVKDLLVLLKKHDLGLASLKPHSLKLEEVFMDILEGEM